MAGWVSEDEPVLATATGIARELGDPIRLTVLQLLAHEGPHGMSQLAEILDITPARLGNHLGKLRDAGLVASEHAGRHVTYRLKDHAVTPLLDALAHYAGGKLPTPGAAPTPQRLCYDHAAGGLGVALLDHLLNRAALTSDSETDDLVFGPNAGPVLKPFAIIPDAFAPGRRKIAARCLDRSLRRPHIAGALGSALLEQLRSAHFVDVDQPTRCLRINPGRAKQLHDLLPELNAPDR